MANKLTAKQEAFVREYLVDLNATQAAIRAGYSANMAGRIGHQLLEKTRVADAIATAQQERIQRTEVSADNVIRELAVLGFSDIRHYVIDDQGHVSLVPRAPDEAMRAVSSLKRKVRQTTDKDGKTTTEYETELRLWNKPDALKMLGQHTGALKSSLELSGPGGGPIEVHDDHTDNILRKLLPELAAGHAPGSPEPADG